ncbi:MAG: hypothetical protein C0399_04555 [Syntrophus sp. (in: bacteria)]|nr:hypothetical protein [Syntrophus sp. (in: bacteria)]
MFIIFAIPTKTSCYTFIKIVLVIILERVYRTTGTKGIRDILNLLLFFPEIKGVEVVLSGNKPEGINHRGR